MASAIVPGMRGRGYDPKRASDRGPGLSLAHTACDVGYGTARVFRRTGYTGPIGSHSSQSPKGGGKQRLLATIPQSGPKKRAPWTTQALPLPFDCGMVGGNLMAWRTYYLRPLGLGLTPAEPFYAPDLDTAMRLARLQWPTAVAIQSIGTYRTLKAQKCY